MSGLMSGEIFVFILWGFNLVVLTAACYLILAMKFDKEGHESTALCDHNAQKIFETIIFVCGTAAVLCFVGYRINRTLRFNPDSVFFDKIATDNYEHHDEATKRQIVKQIIGRDYPLWSVKVTDVWHDVYYVSSAIIDKAIEDVKKKEQPDRFKQMEIDRLEKAKRQMLGCVRFSARVKAPIGPAKTVIGLADIRLEEIKLIEEYDVLAHGPNWTLESLGAGSFASL